MATGKFCKTNIGRCCLCGQEKPLTLEHVPPKKAFNNFGLLMYKMDSTSGEARYVPAGPLSQDGHKVLTLCAKCNNNTGGWYGRAYIEFAHACSVFADIHHANKIACISKVIYPLNVAKQALVIMCSCCGVGLTDKHPDIRRLLLNKSEQGLLRPLRLFAYIKCDPGGRTSGISGVVRVDKGQSRVVADFAWWPLGFVLSFSDLPIEEAVDITHWFDIDFKTSRSETLELPCRWACTPFPIDFRSPDQVKKEAEQNKLII